MLDFIRPVKIIAYQNYNRQSSESFVLKNRCIVLGCREDTIIVISYSYSIRGHLIGTFTVFNLLTSSKPNFPTSIQQFVKSHFWWIILRKTYEVVECHC